MDIEREHPEYAARKAMWRMYRDLYAGGEQIKTNATEYLVRRQKEPADVYSERLARVFYENYIGSIIDWYAATLFRREPILSFTGENEAAKAFFCELADDCDLRQTNLSDFFRKQLVEALVNGTAYILVDFPRSPRPGVEPGGRRRAGSVASVPGGVWRGGPDQLEPRRAGEFRVGGAADLKPSARRGVQHRMDERDALGVLRQAELPHLPAGGQSRRAGPTGADRRRAARAGGPGTGASISLRVSEGLWLMNKAALLQLEHFNKSNALGWALTMGLFAMPVVYSDREWKQIVGESYYIQLGPEDKFGWTEPEGHVYQIAVENLTRLKDEIYRVCYLTPQAWDSAKSQSGLSKQRDFTITQEVLRAYGDAIKDTMKRVLRAIEAARQDELTVDVSGLDEFDIGDFSSELDDAERLLKLDVGSPTLRREVFKKLAYKYLCDVRQELKDQIATEIERANAD